jgi:hypothetical protein
VQLGKPFGAPHTPPTHVTTVSHAGFGSLPYSQTALLLAHDDPIDGALDGHPFTYVGDGSGVPGSTITSGVPASSSTPAATLPPHAAPDAARSATHESGLNPRPKCMTRL